MDFKSLKRRDFVKLCSGGVAGFGISQMFHPAVAEAISGSLDGTRPPVIWLQGQGCTGCSVTLLNASHPSIADLLLKIISLEFHQTLMGMKGEPALGHLMDIAEKYKGKFFLVLEGAIPIAEKGAYCKLAEIKGEHYTIARLVKELAPKSAAMLAIGTCASYGGIPAAEGNQTGATSARDFLKSEGIATPIVNIPGCPPHPDWIVGTLTVALAAIKQHGLEKGLGEVVKLLDEEGRPTPFFGNNIHENCPYLKAFESEKMASTFMDKKNCRFNLGCKGPSTMADCYSRKWNGGVNWCVQNAVCIGCVEPDFPDGKSPFYSS